MLPFEFDKASSNSLRYVDEWLPIHAWTVEDVWDRIRFAGTRHHSAYDKGMPRLSCRFCILASKSALVLSAKENPDEAATILAEEAKISQEVAERELFERTVLDMDPVPGETQIDVLRAVIPIMVAENQVRPGTDLEAVLAELLAPEIAAGVVAAAEPAA